MKKNLLYILLLAAPILFATCAKEDNIKLEEVEELGDKLDIPVEDGYTIKVYVADGDITKTAYAGETTFSWVGNEVISLQTRCIKEYKTFTVGTYDRWKFANSSEAGTIANFRSTGSFSSENWELCNIAFYPVAHESFDVGDFKPDTDGNNADRPNKIYVGNYSKPSVSNQMCGVPLIGIKDQNGNYGFHTAMGLLKITVSNIDSRLSKVQLYAPGQKLNGTFTLTGSENGTYVAMTTSSTASEQIFNVQYSDWTNEASLPFYFPVPVGTLNSGFKVRLLDSGSNVLRQVSAPSDVLIERNKISEITTAIPLPAEDFSATITPSGTSAALTANVVLGADATSIKLVLANTADAGYTLINGSNATVKTLVATGDTDVFSYENISTSGAKYIVAKTYQGDTEKNSYAIPVKVLMPTEVATCGTFERTEINVNSGASTFVGEWSGDGTLTIEPSNDPANSYYMISEFAGFSFDPSRTTDKAKEVSGIELSETVGSPLYCTDVTLATGTSSAKSTFYPKNSQPFFTDSSGNEYYLTDQDGAQNRMGYVRVVLNSKYYTPNNATQHDLIVFGSRIELYKSSGTVVKVYQYVGNKKP